MGLPLHSDGLRCAPTLGKSVEPLGKPENCLKNVGGCLEKYFSKTIQKQYDTQAFEKDHQRRSQVIDFESDNESSVR